MNAPTLNAYLGARADDPALRLIADTAAAMRADADYLEQDEDPAAAAFLADETPVALGGDALDQVLARIERAGEQDRRATDRAHAAHADPRLAELAELPSPVREAAFEAFDRDGWRFTAFGIRELALEVGAGMKAVLMRIEPGVGVFHHDHAGDEVTLVLTGAYNDGHARFGPGDVSLARPGFVHAPRAEPDAVCYVLAASEGPPRLQGLPGLVQRIIGRP